MNARTIIRDGAAVGAKLTMCPRCHLLQATHPTADDCVRDLKAYHARLHARVEVLAASLADLRAAAEEVNDRFIGGSRLNGRLGEALEKLAVAAVQSAVRTRPTAAPDTRPFVCVLCDRDDVHEHPGSDFTDDQP